MRKLATFSKPVNKKGKETRGEIWHGDLCTMQDSHTHPLNISLFFAAEFIVHSEFVAVGGNRDSATKCSFKVWLRTEETNYVQFKHLFVCKLPHKPNIYTSMM